MRYPRPKRAKLSVDSSLEQYSDGSRDFAEVESAVAAADELEAGGVAVERTAAVGTVSREIIEHADEIDADQIVMGGRKRSGVAKVLVGSSTQDVIFSTDQPLVATG